MRQPDWFNNFPISPSRRRFLHQFAGGMLTAGIVDLSRSSLPGADDFTPLRRYPRMVHDYYVNLVRQVALEQRVRIEQLATREDAEAYVLSVREKIRSCFGREPSRTPLNPQITGVVKRNGYHIEKVIFESRPGFHVTGNLYVPEGRSGPFPGVVGLCGHSPNGKAAETYQSYSQGLARLGYVCLIIDPIGQGERLQYLNEKSQSAVGYGVSEHLQIGNQQHLVGESLWRWRSWDGIRALDYLLTRQEVDPQHIGVTGNSGGGTIATWLCGLDSRWTMAAPSCFVTTILRNLRNELPTDPEQCPPRILAAGLDHSDFLAAMAPRPVIILAKERDFFDVRGAEEAYVLLRRLYALLDAEENIALFVAPTPHGYSGENREAMYSWFERCAGRHSNHPVPDSGPVQFRGILRNDGTVPFRSEPVLTIEPDDTLQCTPRGQVALLAGEKTVFDFTHERAQALAREREPLSEAELLRRAGEVLKLAPRPETTPDFTFWRELKNRDYPAHAVGYAIECEPGIEAIVYRLSRTPWQSRPPRSGAQAMLYIAHQSSDLELREEPLIRELMDAHKEIPLFTCDVRGIGDSWPGTVRGASFSEWYGVDYFYSTQGLMLDRPYLGLRVFDILRVLDWLASIGHVEIHLIGKGWGALSATFAALFSKTVQQVTLKNALTSFTDLAQTEFYTWPLSAMLPDVLSNFDLPDCYALLSGKQLRQIDPLDGAGNPVDRKSRG